MRQSMLYLNQQKKLSIWSESVKDIESRAGSVSSFGKQNSMMQ